MNPRTIVRRPQRAQVRRTTRVARAVVEPLEIRTLLSGYTYTATPPVEFLSGGAGIGLANTGTGVNGAPISTSVVGTTLPSLFVPGDRAVAKLTITNNGSVAAHGVLGVQLYASTDGTLANATPLSAVGLSHIPINLSDGKSQAISGTFTVPFTLPPGTYSLVAVSSVVSGFTNTAVDTTPAVSPGTATETLSFGTVGARHGLRLVIGPANGGDVTCLLSGPGTGTLNPDGNGGFSLTVSGTSAGSSLVLAATGAAAMGEPLDSLTVNGSIGSIIAPKIDLNGALSIQGSARIVEVHSVTGGIVFLGGDTPSILELGSLTDAPIVSTDPLTLLEVSSFTNSGNVDPIIAPSIGTLLDQGDFSGDVSATKIGTLLIKGNVTNSNVLAGTNFGNDGLPGGGDDTFAAGTIGALRISGTIDGNTLIAAGLDSGDDIFPLDIAPTLLPGGKIGTINVHGTVGQGTQILAASLPKVAIIGGVPVKTS